jgi:HAD superfamily hydrolase (TIGR01509 family)
MSVAVIFDLDGTLVNSEPNYFAAELRVFRECGILEFDEEQQRRYVGMSTRQVMMDARCRYGLADSLDSLADRTDAYYLELARAGTEVFPEMRALLRLLRTNGYPLALASGSSITVLAAVMEQTQLSEFFRVMVSTDDVARGKPHPDVLIEASRRLGVRASTCVVVEDAIYGVVAARRAGMRCIAVPSQSEQALQPEFAAADLLFPRGIADFKAGTAFAWIEHLGSRRRATE